MTLLIIVCAVGILACLGFIWYLKLKQKRASEEFVEAQKKDKKNYFRFLYKIYSLTPVVRRYLTNLRTKYQSIFPADDITIETMVTKRMTLGVAIFLSIITGISFVCKFDIPYMIIGVAGAYIIFTHVMNTSDESLERKLLDQLDIFIDDVSSYYHDTKDVGEAIDQTLDTLPYEISLHAQRIKQIVASADPNYEMESYIEVAPNRFLLLTAAVCASIAECGDKEIDGKSLFITSLNYIKEELNAERIYLMKKQAAYAGKIIGVTVPLFMLKPAEILLLHSMPELASFYHGAAGVITLSLITIIDIICYELINIAKNTGKVTNDVAKSDSKIKKISEIRFVKSFLVAKANKHYSKSLKETDMLNGTGSTDTWNTYTLKRYAWALALFIIANVVFIFGNIRDKAYVFSDFTSAYGQSLVPSEEYRQEMQKISVDVTGEVKKADNIEDIVREYVLAYDYNENMIPDITDELTERVEKYRTIYYKWWMLLIAIGVSAIGYYIPAFMLKQKAKVMEMKRNDEVAQFKTLIMILMHMDGMMLDEVLVWMNRFARVYKSALSECIMNFEWSQQKSLEAMKEKESGFAPFRRLCDSLMAVDAVGLERAFDSLETDRDFQNKKREEDNNNLLKKESSKASTLMMIPIYAVITGYIVVPFGLYVANMATQFTGIF